MLKIQSTSSFIAEKKEMYKDKQADLAQEDLRKAWRLNLNKLELGCLKLIWEKGRETKKKWSSRNL